MTSVGTTFRLWRADRGDHPELVPFQYEGFVVDRYLSRLERCWDIARFVSHVKGEIPPTDTSVVSSQAYHLSAPVGDYYGESSMQGGGVMSWFGDDLMEEGIEDDDEVQWLAGGSGPVVEGSATTTSRAKDNQSFLERCNRNDTYEANPETHVEDSSAPQVS